MMNDEKKIDVNEACECDCEVLKAELEQAKETIKQYEDAYKDLQTKFNRLYGILGNQIDYALNIK